MKNLLEILVKDDIQKIFDYFFSILGIRILFYSAMGKEIKVGFNRPDSNFCRLIQDKLYGEEKCLSLDEENRRECLIQKKLINYQCHAGIEEVVTPVYIGYQLAGFAMIGQFRSRENLLYKVKNDWKNKYDLAEIEEAFYKLPYFKPEKVKDIIGLFSILIDYIVTKEIISYQGNMTIWRIFSYIEENISKKVSLPEVAKLVNKSDSTVSHLFSKTLGKTFKQTLISAKLNKAEELLIQMPHLTIQEVAERVGFSDQFYFSRLYKQHRNMYPSYFRRHFREK